MSHHRDKANGNKCGKDAAAEQPKRAANGGKVARAKRGRSALETSSDSGAEEPKTALKRRKSTAKADQKPANTAKASRTGKSAARYHSLAKEAGNTSRQARV